ncbi:MAG: cytochrome b N-terminal domain-containing protein [Proteobacteria bacterium]|nr:cytochrome b N-terminal domain-containing protein [Pseudomonadota bacterium]
MSGQSTYQPRSRFMQWMEARLPVMGLVHSSFVAYPTPRNLNYWWTFGGILSFMLVVQIVTGIVLVMHFTPHVDMAFNSVEHIMRDVNYGWLLRYLHSNGASMFFLACYIHMFRGMYYGSYKEPREVLWILGVIIYLLMMATGFMGYVLPWGQMSFWAATVITNLFSAIPIVGDPVVTWLWGGYAVGNPTLQRFFSLHYLLPFAIAGVVVLHVWALHVVGQNNPTGIEPTSDKDTLPFTPYATVKDAFFLAMFAIVFAWFVFYIPNYLGHPDNYIPANPGVTPVHIVPEWYYLPFYAILRAIPNKLLGVIALFSSIAILAFLPWLDTSRVKSANYRPLYRQFFWLFVIVCVGLGWLGSKPAEGGYVIASRLLTAWYFLHFIVVLPLLGFIEKPRALPMSISESVLKGKGAAALLAAIVLAGLAGFARPATAAEQVAPPRVNWSFAGPFGNYDRAQLQRGFKIYREICQSCHSLSLLSLRNLGETGGPDFSPPQVASIAAEYKVKDGPNDQGEMFERAGRPADRFPAPFPNEQAARAANGGALPPDLSVIAKARGYERGFPWFVIDAVTQFQEHGPDYIVAVLTGYADPPANFKLAAGAAYNRYFPGNAIGMPKPLSDGIVTYTDGTPQTADQYAKDVTAFLMWAAEPHLEARKRIGFQTMIFLIVLAGLLYFIKKKVWSHLHDHA